MLYATFVPVYLLALEVSVNLMEVEAVGARDERLCLEYVSPEFIDVAGLARIVSGCLDASGEVSGAFKSCNVICLPAVHAEVEFLELGNDLLGIYAILCVALLGYRISLACRFFHILCS